MSELDRVSSCYHADWLSYVIKDSEREAEDFSNVKLLHARGRAALWNICTILGFQSYGIPGQACLILERYLYSIFLNYSMNPDPRLQKEIIIKAQKRCFAMITGSILLAAKINTARSHKTNANIVQLSLKCKGITLSVDEIIATEMDIFNKLNYRLPLWNTVDIALFIATEMKVSADKMRGIELIVDLSEYYKLEIENDLRQNNQLPPQFQRNGYFIRSLHIAAAAIAAASRLSNTPDPSSALTKLVKVPTILIQCICDFIVKKIRSNHQRYQPTILKRRNVS